MTTGAGNRKVCRKAWIKEKHGSKEYFSFCDRIVSRNKKRRIFQSKGYSQQDFLIKFFPVTFHRFPFIWIIFVNHITQWFVLNYCEVRMLPPQLRIL